MNPICLISLEEVNEWNRTATDAYVEHNTPRCPYADCERVIDPAQLRNHVDTCPHKPGTSPLT